MATYYIRADGTAANKAAAGGPGSSRSACMSPNTHDGETFSAGDVIRIADDGGVIRDNLTPPSSGSSGNPITYEAESVDTPIISGANLIATWTEAAVDDAEISDNFDDNNLTGWTTSGGVEAANQRLQVTVA